jgi:hypothetical protein
VVYSARPFVLAKHWADGPPLSLADNLHPTPKAALATICLKRLRSLRPRLSSKSTGHLTESAGFVFIPGRASQSCYSEVRYSNWSKPHPRGLHRSVCLPRLIGPPDHHKEIGSDRAPNGRGSFVSGGSGQRRRTERLARGPAAINFFMSVRLHAINHRLF